VGDEQAERAAWDGSHLLLDGLPGPAADLAIARLLVAEVRGLPGASVETQRAAEIVAQCVGRSSEYVSELFRGEYGTDLKSAEQPVEADSEKAPTHHPAVGGSSEPESRLDQEEEQVFDEEESEPVEERSEKQGEATAEKTRKRYTRTLQRRLARALGFVPHGDRWLRSQREELREVRGDALPWEIWSYPGGEQILRRLAVVEANLHEPVEIEEETWSLLDGYATHSLVLLHRGGGHAQFSGKELAQRRADGTLRVVSSRRRLLFAPGMTDSEATPSEREPL